MQNNNLKSIYEKLNFSNISSDTFISAYKIYDEFYFHLSSDERVKFEENIAKFSYKYLGLKKDGNDIINDLKLLRDNRILTYNKYWDFVISTNALNLIDDVIFKKIICSHLIPLYQILYNKNVSRKYSSVIKEILLTSDNGIEFYTNQYDFPKDVRYTYYLPKLTEDEIDLMIGKYISSSSRNPNHLKALKAHKNNKDSYIIKPERFVDIEKAYIACFNDPNIITNKVSGPMTEIGLSEEVMVPFYHGYFKGYNRYVSSKRFIDDNLNNEKYMNILIHSLNLIDEQGRIKNIYNPYNEHALVALENRTVNQYGGLYFNEQQEMANIHFASVADYLNNINHSIENYLEYIVNENIEKEYKIKGFHIDLHVEDRKFKIKCEHLFNEMQNFIKQYISYCKIGSVSIELMKRLSFSGYCYLESKIDLKYFIVNNNSNIIKVFRLIFSDQSPLNYVEKYKDDDFSFFQLISLKQVKREDYNSKSSLESIDFLIDEGLIAIKDGLLVIANLQLIIILKELYEKGFVDYYYLKDNYKNIVDALFNKSWLIKENKLLSTLESNFFEYYLSDKKYTDNPGLRNKYEHGASPYLSDDEAKSDYYIGLKLFCLLILKVKEDIKISRLNKNLNCKESK